MLGWHSRGYLPHFDGPERYQVVTYRLADALPEAVVAQLSELATEHPKYRLMVESKLNAGYGSCILREALAAKCVVDNLRHFDGVRYRLLAWVVMPNHVHVLFLPMSGWTVAAIVHSWKSYTAKRIGRIYGLPGRVWHPEYFDRYIRDSNHFAAAVRYIVNNPVAGGVAQEIHEWPWVWVAPGLVAGEPPAVHQGS